MLGYVKAFKPELKIKDYELYRGIYCSLCRALGRNYSPIAQLFLSYDFAFAAVLRLAAEENGCCFKKKRCPYNPMKKCMICRSNDVMDFCSHALIITVYYKLLDNMHDSGIKSKIIAYLLYPIVFLMYKKAAKLAPETDKIIAQSMEMQSAAEKKPDVGIDEVAHPSADALGKIFSDGFDGERKNSMYTLGYMIGRYVYILDAVDDLEEDLKNGSFNPFRSEYNSIKDENIKKEFCQRAEGMLNLTQSSALDALDTLEKKRFDDILENIVLDGLTFSAKRAFEKYCPEEKANNIYTVE